jgi:hypothetical protein
MQSPKISWVVLCAAFALQACAVNVRPPVAGGEEEEDAGKRRDAGKADAGIQDAGVDETDGGDEMDAGTEEMDAGTHPLVPESWGTPVPLQGLNSKSLEMQPSMTGDMLRLCFSSDRSGGKGKADIWCSFRDTTDDDWGPPVNQGNINSAEEDWAPGLSDNGSELFFASSRSSPGQMKIYRATWVPQAGGYGSAQQVSELNFGTDIWSNAPMLSQDGLTLFFESAKAGGYGFIDVWVTTRLSTSSYFGQSFNVTALNSAELDAAPGPSSDLQVMTFTSEREGGVAFRAIWRSEAKASGGWTTPVPAVIAGDSNFAEMANSRILPDGSLLFNGELKNSSNKDDLFIAPPIW